MLTQRLDRLGVDWKIKFVQRLFHPQLQRFLVAECDELTEMRGYDKRRVLHTQLQSLRHGVSETPNGTLCGLAVKQCLDG